MESVPTTTPTRVHMGSRVEFMVHMAVRPGMLLIILIPVPTHEGRLLMVHMGVRAPDELTTLTPELTPGVLACRLPTERGVQPALTIHTRERERRRGKVQVPTGNGV